MERTGLNGRPMPQGELAEMRCKQCLALPASLTHEVVTPLWDTWSRVVAIAPGKIELDAAAVEVCDSAGVALVSHLHRVGREHHVTVTLTHTHGSFHQLWHQVIAQVEQGARPLAQKEGMVVETGRAVYDLWQDTMDLVAFVGRFCWMIIFLISHPRRFRWQDFCELLELVGVQAVGLIAILGLLFGMIMGFSSAMPLRQFGVEIYVADLVAYAMVRVLGPFITAVIMAGRTGSAFAAEIGTMKIRNELDALQVMSLDPGVFLVIPRVAATMVMTPLLAFVANVAGIVGCGFVILSLGYPLQTYWTHVQEILTSTDVLVGMVKATVFGFLVGIVGCYRGLKTESGPGAVGIATTQAVVTAIVLLILAEGVFSVLLYVLEL